MMGLLLEAGERRGRLLTLSAQRRREFAEQLLPLRGPLTAADRGISLIRTLKAHPEWVALGAAGLVVLKPLRTLRWLRGALLVWRLLPFLRGLARRGAYAAMQEPMRTRGASG
jgi:hypothetical protein